MKTAVLAFALLAATTVSAVSALEPQVPQPSNPPARFAVIYTSPNMSGSDLTYAQARAWQEYQELTRRGYRVIMKSTDAQEVVFDDIWNGVSAIAFFGHGGTDTSGNAASTFASLTAEQWQSGLFSSFRLRYLRMGYPIERADAAASARARSVGLELMRNYSCRSLYDANIAHLFVRPGGEYFGAPYTLTGGPIAQGVSWASPEVCSTVFGYLLGYSFELHRYVVPSPQPPAPTPVPVPTPTPTPASPCQRAYEAGWQFGRSGVVPPHPDAVAAQRAALNEGCLPAFNQGLAEGQRR